MKMEANNKSFFDSNTILALVVTFALFFLWQRHLEKKYPNSKKQNSVESVKESEKPKTLPPTHGGLVSAQDKISEKVSENEKLQTHKIQVFEYKDEFWSFKLNSQGLALEDVHIFKVNAVAKKPYHLGFSDSFFEAKLNGKPLYFDVKRTSDKVFEAKARLDSGEEVTQVLEVDSENYLIKVKGKTQGSGKLSYVSRAKIEDPKKVVFFMPAFDRNEFYVKTKSDSSREVLVTKNVMEKPSFYEGTQLASLSDHYFSAAFLNAGNLSPKTEFQQKGSELYFSVDYSFSQNVEIKEFSYNLFLGPKRLDLLEGISEDLTSIVDFTYLGFIARPILKGLNFLYGILGNYGLAVIVLTLLIRLLILPLAVSSFRSMKKMQKIQPELKRIKEKYKDQPQKVNQMTMQIMKENQVNPLGGCLPMLFQLPIFFAFYRGLSESVDLYQAPFVFWIKDLSKMDPYFVFPILSMVGMVVHQLVTPSNMEKAQKRMMMIMPVVFGIFFVTLPSALTLYMAVSTWFGIGQHYIFLREKA